MPNKKSLFAAVRILAPTTKAEGISNQDLQKELVSCFNRKEDGVSGQGQLVLFSFDKFPETFLAARKYLAVVKDKCKSHFSPDKIPVQILFYHISDSPTLIKEIKSTTSAIWAQLENTSIYITKNLKTNWYQMLGGQQLPSHMFEDKSNDLYIVKFLSSTNGKTGSFFAHRGLVLQGKSPKCFYCGSTTHGPAKCPSKLLAPEMLGIKEIGHFSINDISEAFQTVFSNLNKYIEIFKNNPSFAEIRKDINLLVFLSFYDLSKIFQPRFLWNMTFGDYHGWKSYLSYFQCKPNNRNLAIGLDCLRVGQYGQAKEMFDKEFEKPFGKYFYATVGLLFISLETENANDVGAYLRKASFLADSQKEKVYVGLLFMRQYLLENDTKNAQKKLHDLLSTFDCSDARYAQVQHEINCGVTDKTLMQLINLIEEHKEFFIMALMDPLLQPAGDIIDDTLSGIFQECKKNSQEGLHEATEECSKFLVWADQEDPKFKASIESIEHLEENFKSDGYFDHLNIINKINGALYALRQTQNAQYDNMGIKLKRLTKKYNLLISYWKKYPFKSFFKNFKTTLRSVKAKLGESRNLHQDPDSSGYAVASRLLKEVESTYIDLDKILNRMVTIKTLVRAGGFFIKRLLVVETFFVGVGAIVWLLSLFLNSEIISQYQVRQAVFFSAFLIAPLTALIVTIVKFANK